MTFESIAQTVICVVGRFDICVTAVLPTDIRGSCYLSLWLIGTVCAEPKTVISRPGFNPQSRQNKLFQDYWRACFEINFSDRQEGLTVSSIICDR